MKDKGFIYALMIIIIAGMAITMSMDFLLTKSLERETAAVTSVQETSVGELPVAGAYSEKESAAMPAAAAPAMAKAVAEEAPDTAMTAYDGAAVTEHQTEAGAEAAEQPKTEAVAAVIPMSPLEPASPIKEHGEEDAALQGGVSESSYYLNRLTELDAQIQKSRESQSASNNYSAKNTASNELKLWDNELNVIYGQIMERLEEKQASALVTEEREWMKERDRLAVEAAKASAGGSLESVEYTASLAESTRLRAYELVNTYGYLLEE